MTKYFTKQEVYDILMSHLSDYTTLDELFNDQFNSDYYIIGIFEAERAVSHFSDPDKIEDGTGFWTALHYLDRHLDDFAINDSQLLHQIKNPEKFANLLEYCIADDIFTNLYVDLNLDADCELTNDDLKRVNVYCQNQK